MREIAKGQRLDFVIPALNCMRKIDTRAAGAIARLDQALAFHPLRPAVLYRARLEAARHAAAVDGTGIDPWHLAAVLEGLRLRMDPSLAMRDRGSLFEAARHACDQYQWLVTPD
ncbi:MAG: hypothetical protein QOD93_1771, partial [Acetobacteraceae bacterium]|nr:hypothetical protein [Acetobacteraceae bacterium]